MGVDDLGVPEIREFGTCFGYEGEGGIVGLKTTSLHLTEEKKGLFGMALVDGVSYVGVPQRKSGED